MNDGADGSTAIPTTIVGTILFSASMRSGCADPTSSSTSIWSSSSCAARTIMPPPLPGEVESVVRDRISCRAAKISAWIPPMVGVGTRAGGEGVGGAFQVPGSGSGVREREVPREEEDRGGGGGKCASRAASSSVAAAGAGLGSEMGRADEVAVAVAAAESAFESDPGDMREVVRCGGGMVGELERGGVAEGGKPTRVGEGSAEGAIGRFMDCFFRLLLLYLYFEDFLKRKKRCLAAGCPDEEKAQTPRALKRSFRCVCTQNQCTVRNEKLASGLATFGISDKEECGMCIGLLPRRVLPRLRIEKSRAFRFLSTIERADEQTNEERKKDGRALTKKLPVYEKV
ncbi:hypothetical protein BC828DRAFT_382055 [Blastocladiella britannica]|nr:hypothetical protein BC828DRAFT_382055 [Blastocladiella britannica]